MAPADEGAGAKRLRERVIRKRLPRRTPRNDATRDASSLIFPSPYGVTYGVWKVAGGYYPPLQEIDTPSARYTGSSPCTGDPF